MVKKIFINFVDCIMLIALVISLIWDILHNMVFGELNTTLSAVVAVTLLYGIARIRVEKRRPITGVYLSSNVTEL